MFGLEIFKAKFEAHIAKGKAKRIAAMTIADVDPENVAGYPEWAKEVILTAFKSGRDATGGSPTSKIGKDE